MTRIFDFSQLELSDRNGTYGGNSGDKEGVFINDEYWIVKYPMNTKHLSGITDFPYSTSPLSEYIGSHVYELLGYPVHETMLGIRNEKVVVACKDLCDDTHRLIEFRQLKNTFNKELSKALDSHFTSTGSQHFVGLEEVISHLQYNPELNHIQGIKERFWDCLLIDGLINNNDRNNGNWGILRNKKESILSPIYDNGSAFSPNVPDSRLSKKLNNLQSLMTAACNGVTAYSLDGEHNLLFRDAIKYENEDLKQAILRVVPIIKQQLPSITEFIKNIPGKCGDQQIISAVRKETYIQELQIRVDKILEPEYQKCMQYDIAHERSSKRHVSLDDMLNATKESSHTEDRSYQKDRDNYER